jgi:hypothetical protein
LDHHVAERSNSNGLGGKQAAIGFAVSIIGGAVAGLGIFQWQGEQSLAPIREQLSGLDRHIQATDKVVAAKRDEADFHEFAFELTRQLQELRTAIAAKADETARVESTDLVRAALVRLERRIERLEDSVDRMRQHVPPAPH